MSERRIVYVQYANPAAYPPVQHSAMLLARSGWLVTLYGAAQAWVAALEFPRHPNVSVQLMPPPASGWQLKLHYVRFCVGALASLWRTRPAWVYASDLLSTPVALLATYRTGTRVLYHEHDLPDAGVRSWFFRGLLGVRQRLLARADMVVVPNAERGELLTALTDRPLPLHTVWNCPERSEVAAAARALTPRPFTITYQGSIVPARLPKAILYALTQLPDVHLRIIGYGTAGHHRYVEELRALADTLGVTARIEFWPCTPRATMLDALRASDLGLSLMPMVSNDPNERHMIGASNKAFEYLAQGLPLLVSDLPDWRSLFVERGVARPCRSDDPDDIARAIAWFTTHRDQAATMGERGRALVAAEWNYESQFLPVEAILNGRAA